MSPNSLSYLLTFGFIALFVSGCGGDTSKPSNSASPSPSVSAAASPSPLASAAPSFTQPVVAGSDSAAAPAPETTVRSEAMAALLPASDSDTVVRNTAKGRTDPFANVVFQTVVETKPGANAVASSKIASSSNTAAPTMGNSGNISNSSASASNSPRTPKGTLGLAGAVASAGKEPAQATSGTVALKPKAIPMVNLDSNPSSAKLGRPAQNQSPLIPVSPTDTALRDLPKPSVVAAPQPAYASNIQVSGVAQVNGQTQVILKLPNESFSRYISVGERVMDGKVLVKRVEGPNAITPVVILEEVGIEVPRKVGEKIVVPAKEGAR